jgi:phage terminase large subunit-like protein
MPDGSLWFVRAANNSVGHGMSCDLIVADEIWDIGTQVIDTGLLPSQRARRSPLLSCWSTAGTEASTAMQRWREQGLRAIDRKEPSSLYFAEWSPPPDISPMDSRAWPWANPALGTTLTQKTIEAEADNPDRAAFLRASCNLWVASDKSWIAPGLWPELEYTDPMPEGGTVAIETSMTDDRYFATRAVVLDDRRTVVTVEFVADTYSEMLTHVERLAKNTTIKFAISPSIDIHWPLALERRRAVVGYGEILKFTPRIKSMINEKLLWHTGETMLAEHVQRAVAVRSQNSIALSSQRSPGPIELARCLVWSAALASRPTSSGKPMIVVASR